MRGRWRGTLHGLPFTAPGGSFGPGDLEGLLAVDGDAVAVDHGRALAVGDEPPGLGRGPLALWDDAKGCFVVAPGDYEIMVGASSADIRQRANLSALPGRA